MRMSRYPLLAVSLIFTAVASGDGEKPVDFRKSRIETPLKAVVAKQAKEALVKVDVRKRVIESPLKSVVGKAATDDAPQTAKRDDATNNPEVQPGLVRWHADWEQAKSAAARSGKPILLFQLLGQLDREFT